MLCTDLNNLEIIWQKLHLQKYKLDKFEVIHAIASFDNILVGREKLLQATVYS